MAVKRITKAFRLLRGASTTRRVAAAVAVRPDGAGGIEFLLVRTSNGARWTFPKGGRERGETLAQAAAREAVEEAGAHGRIGEQPIGAYPYGDDLVTAFLLEVDATRPPAEDGRSPTWFGLHAARDRLAEGRDPGFGARIEHVLLAAEQARQAAKVTHTSR